MKYKIIWIVLPFIVLNACQSSQTDSTSAIDIARSNSVGQSGIVDDASQYNVVQVAVGSKEHTTLVAAVKAGELVDALSNAGPFTVFAPTNDAFNKLPAGTVENLLKPESKETLVDILQYHVSVGVYKTDAFQDGQNIGQVNGNNITINKKGNDFFVNGNAKIIASIPASNGIIHVVDGVLLPPKK